MEDGHIPSSQKSSQYVTCIDNWKGFVLMRTNTQLAGPFQWCGVLSNCPTTSCHVRYETLFCVCFLIIIHMEWILGETLSEQVQHVSHMRAAHILYCDVCDFVVFYLQFFLHRECYWREMVSAFPTFCTNGDNTAKDTHMSIQAVEH